MRRVLLYLCALSFVLVQCEAGGPLGAPIAALMISGMIALKGAAIIGLLISGLVDDEDYRDYGDTAGNEEGGGDNATATAPERRWYRKRRSAQDISATESHLLSVISRLDTHGCILKTMCYLQEGESPDTLTTEESVLVDLLSNAVTTFSKEVNATVLLSTGGIGATFYEGDCDSLFSRCPYGKELLRGFLRQAWGCGIISV
ncbi:uncharacterized protein [Penaeus vannamei]|uniref:Uncharacterized protein n=1 Tax=Penaeus vannamei TaxID=6689 RepID=A0A3R7SYV8_PENVA|nr:uncharacterized protein LOC113801018 [Penaeus vannamei]ROT82309.1 hypothetical protein C7M84_024547 [Penaeus vannamei]